jgi:hypothetical protein
MTKKSVSRAHSFKSQSDSSTRRKSPKSKRAHGAAKPEKSRKEVDYLRQELTQMHEQLLRAVSHDLERTHVGEKAASGKTAYLALALRLRETIKEVIPPKSKIIVVSKGDDLLTEHKGRRAQHFPQNRKGAYAGFYPANSAEAIAQVELLRKKGSDYLVFPATAFWWLDYYKQFNRYLERTYRTVHRSVDTCVIFSLRKPSPWREMSVLVEQVKKQRRSSPAILDWQSGASLAEKFSECAVFAPLEPSTDELPYLDKTIDIVAVDGEALRRRAEAHRVAAEAIVWVTTNDQDEELQLRIEMREVSHASRE